MRMSLRHPCSSVRHAADQASASLIAYQGAYEHHVTMTVKAAVDTIRRPGYLRHRPGSLGSVSRRNAHQDRIRQRISAAAKGMQPTADQRD